LKSFVNREVSSLRGGCFEDRHYDTGGRIKSQVLRIINRVSVEYDMNSGNVSLFGRLCCGLTMAVLALAVSLDSSRVVRAEDADDLTISLQGMVVNPIMKTVRVLEARLSSLETTISAMADSFSSRRIVAQVLCVSDDTGGQTCITKAQLDMILNGIARAEISQPPAAVTETNAVPIEEPIQTTVTKDRGQYPEQNGAVEEKSTTDQVPERTGTIQSASSNAAIVLNPEAEITEEPAPVQSTPSEPTGQSDD
jgi:hypothetical protein